jgi:hypothetical protein
LSYPIPKEWLRYTPERKRAEEAVDSCIYQKALSHCAEMAKLLSVDDFPQSLREKLRRIVDGTVREAVSPAIYADLRDPKVQAMIALESSKRLIRSLQTFNETQTQPFITPDLSEAEFQAAFQIEQERIAEEERQKTLRVEEDLLEEIYRGRQAYASAGVSEELAQEPPRKRPEITDVLDEPRSSLEEENESMAKIIREREQRRRMILSRVDEPEVPEWLKHAVDMEDSDYFPTASGRFSKKPAKTREDLLANFFQRELDDVPLGSEEEAKLLEALTKLIEDTESGVAEDESVEDIQKRVHLMLKQIEDRKVVQAAGSKTQTVETYSANS